MKNSRRILPVLGSKCGLHFAVLLSRSHFIRELGTTVSVYIYIYHFVPSLFQGVAYPNFSRETPGSDVSLRRNIVSLTRDILRTCSCQSLFNLLSDYKSLDPSKEGNNDEKNKKEITEVKEKGEKKFVVTIAKKSVVLFFSWRQMSYTILNFYRPQKSYIQYFKVYYFHISFSRILTRKTK